MVGENRVYIDQSAVMLVESLAAAGRMPARRYLLFWWCCWNNLTFFATVLCGRYFDN